MIKTAAILTAFTAFGIAPMATAPSAFEADLAKLESPVASTQVQLSYIAVTSTESGYEATIAPGADFSFKMKTKSGLNIRIGF